MEKKEGWSDEKVSREGKKKKSTPQQALWVTQRKSRLGSSIPTNQKWICALLPPGLSNCNFMLFFCFYNHHLLAIKLQQCWLTINLIKAACTRSHSVQQKQSPIDLVHERINSSPLEAIRDYLWLLRLLSQNREDSREDGPSRAKGKKMKGGKRWERKDCRRGGWGTKWGRAVMEWQWLSHVKISPLNLQFPSSNPSSLIVIATIQSYL